MDLLRDPVHVDGERDAAVADEAESQLLDVSGGRADGGGGTLGSPCAPAPGDGSTSELICGSSRLRLLRTLSQLPPQRRNPAVAGVPGPIEDYGTLSGARPRPAPGGRAHPGGRPPCRTRCACPELLARVLDEDRERRPPVLLGSVGVFTKLRRRLLASPRRPRSRRSARSARSLGTRHGSRPRARPRQP